MHDETRPSRSWRVLVIDDEEIDRLTIQRALESSGHQVNTAANGADGLAIASRFAPHVILVDIHLPQLDGYEVCERIRSTESGKLTAIYAMTGFKNLEDLQRAHRVGFDGFLAKPLDAEALCRLLR